MTASPQPLWTETATRTYHRPVKTLTIVHVSASLSRIGGGISATVRAIATEQARAGHRVSVAGIVDEHTDSDTAEFADIPLALGRVVGPKALGYSPQLKRHLGSIDGRIDIVHCHGLWMWHNETARWLARRHNAALVISPDGMLEPWALQRSVWKKRLVNVLFQRRALRAAVCLHAAAAKEADNARTWGWTKPITVYPNGVYAHEYDVPPDKEAVAARCPALAGKKLLVFLSRVHPAKGLPTLVRVWADLCQTFADWQLVIAGPDEVDHQAQIEREAKSLGIGQRITFLGPVYGQAKTQLLAASDLFVLPTHSENFGIVVAEALAAGRPVITTTGAPWEGLASHQCGWWIEIGADPLAHALRQAMSLSDDQRSAMGGRGRAWVNEEFAWPAIARQSIQTYLWLAGHAEAPPCVRIE